MVPISNKLAVTIGVGVTLVSGAVYYYYKYVYKNEQIPEKWRRIGTLERVNVFPVKSCAPLKLSPEDVISCDVLGLRLDGLRDRALMLVDDKNVMITGRAYPRLVLVETEATSTTKLLLRAPDMDNLELDVASFQIKDSGEQVSTAVWGCKVVGMRCGNKYDKWFSKYLLNKETGIKLIYYWADKPTRKIHPDKAQEPNIKRTDTGAFSDTTSYMLMNHSSINDLNTRLNKPVDPLQFRGNFYLRMDTDVPYAEDDFDWLKIGDEAVFRAVAPCTRCIFPNINVYTGERDPDMQPLKSLNSYRKCGKPSGVLGVHLALRKNGTIKVNDIIYVGEN